MAAPVIAIIPARGGSRRVPGKNIRDFHGRPMLAWTIENARLAGIFDEIVVSTDDPQVSGVAEANGASAPFVRPAELADDYTGTQPVIAHAISALALAESALVCCLYPAAALLTPEDLRLSSTIAKASGGDPPCASVVAYPHPVARALRLDSSGQLTWQDPAAAPSRTQDLPSLVHDAGQFYWASPARWRSGESLLNGAYGYRLPAWRAVDIDTEEDWDHAAVIAAGLRAMACGISGGSPPP